jgi:hypothetical protein
MWASDVPPINQCSVGATQVFYDELVAMSYDLGVMARHLGVIQDHVIVLRPPNGQPVAHHCVYLADDRSQLAAQSYWLLGAPSWQGGVPCFLLGCLPLI